MAKSFKAFRFNPTLYKRFKELVSQSGFTITGAFERFMETCVKQEALVWPEGQKVEDAEAEARIMLAWLKKDEYWYYVGNRNLSVKGRLLQLLPKVRNVELRKEIEEELKNR